MSTLAESSLGRISRPDPLHAQSSGVPPGFGDEQMPRTKCESSLRGLGADPEVGSPIVGVNDRGDCHINDINFLGLKIN